MADAGRTARVAVRVILVEDDDAHARLAESFLAEDASTYWDVRRVASLDEARKALAESRFDAALLDLGLPDSAGLEGVKALLEAQEDLPIVVLTSQRDPGLSLRALKSGAQDFIDKSEAGDRGLGRALRYAITRGQILNVERAHASRMQAEIHRLEPPEAAHVEPGVLDWAHERYNEALTLALENHIFNVEHPITDVLSEIAKKLGAAGASARDVIQLYSRSLKLAPDDESLEAQMVRLDEGRLRTLQLMGMLMDRYRSQALEATHA